MMRSMRHARSAARLYSCDRCVGVSQGLCACQQHANGPRGTGTTNIIPMLAFLLSLPSSVIQ